MRMGRLRGPVSEGWVLIPQVVSGGWGAGPRSWRLVCDGLFTQKVMT